MNSQKSENNFENIKQKLREFQAARKVSAFSIKDELGQPKIWISWYGPQLDQDVEKEIRQYKTSRKPLNQEFYFFNDELRPGSGLIRVFGGKSEGPGGTLTCLLSSKDGQDQYFVSAAHVLTNFWRETRPDPVGSIYRYRKGFPATNSTRFLGKITYLSPDKLPPTVEEDKKGDGVELDLGIVRLSDPEGLDLKQRTTCYGSFGEWPPKVSSYVCRGDPVMKCGSQETHWTKAWVFDTHADVPIYGPDGKLYRFSNQVILSDRNVWRPKIKAWNEEYADPSGEDYPRNPKGTPFAVPGDSGTLVVDKYTKRPVGMLIAGSILNGLYVMTPFEIIRRKLESIKLVALRA